MGEGELKAWKGQDSGRTTRMPGIYKFLLPEDELGNFLIFGWAKEVWVNVCYMSRGKIFFLMTIQRISQYGKIVKLALISSYLKLMLICSFKLFLEKPNIP